ncbi:MAG: hypothetical protein QM744_04205 [Mesorhizobium sp.]
MNDNPSTTKRMSYQPEYVYGDIPDANGRWTGQYGLKPWPAHLQARQTASESNASSEPTTFLSVTPSMRKKLAATFEALIALLDEIDGDCDVESTLGAPERSPEPHRGKRGPVYGKEARDNEGDQTNWADGANAAFEDDCETDNEDNEDGGDNEPNLGWTGHGIGCLKGEQTDDREEDAGDD